MRLGRLKKQNTVGQRPLGLLLGASPGRIYAASDPVLAPDAAAEPPIKRFSKVADRLYRGGQPAAADFAYLRALGIRTVISLREDDQERHLVESLGMQFVHIPITFTPFGRSDMPRDAVERFLEVVDDPASGAVFVHCKRGADRTGAFVGLYRMLRQDWNLDRAYDEAREIGMRWWYFGVKNQLQALAMSSNIRAAE